MRNAKLAACVVGAMIGGGGLGITLLDYLDNDLTPFQSKAQFASFGLLFAASALLAGMSGKPARDGAEDVRAQKTYGDAKPADAESVHKALQGKATNVGQPAHDYDYDD